MCFAWPIIWVALNPNPIALGTLPVPDPGPLTNISGMSLSPDRAHLAATVRRYRDGRPGLVIWDTKTREEIYRNYDASLDFYSPSFLSGSGELAATVYDRSDQSWSVRIWEVPGGEVVRRVEGCSLIRAVGGKLVCRESGDGAAVLVDPEKPDGRSDPLPIDPKARHFRHHDAGGLLAWVGGDRRVRVMDLESKKILRTFTGSQRIDDLAFDPDGKSLAAIGMLVGRADSVGLSWLPLWFWDLRTGECWWEVRRQLDRQNANCLAYLSGRHLLLGGTNGVLLVDLKMAKVRRPFARAEGRDGEVLDLAVSRDGRLMVTLHGSNELRLWLLPLLPQN